MKTSPWWPWVLVVPLAACGADVVVESNTSWAGDICEHFYCAAEYTDHELRGSGNKSFSQDSEQICYWFGKTTDSGYVRVYIKEKDIFGSSRNAEHETSASHGSVSACLKPLVL